MKGTQRARFVAIATSWGLVTAAQGAMVLPPEVSGSALAERAAELLRREPWIYNPGNISASTAAGYLGTVQAVLRKLREDDDFRKAAAARPDLRRLRVEALSLGKATRYTLKAELAATVGAAVDFDALRARILERLAALEAAPFQSLTTGLLRSLPADKSRDGFALDVPAEKLAFLRAELPKVPIESLRKSFQAARYGLGSAWTVEEALSLVERSIANADALATEGMQLLWHAEPPSSGQLSFDAEKEALDRVRAIVEADGTSKANWKLAAAELQPRFAEMFTFQEAKVLTASREVVLRELDPETAYFRGAITGDCSTTDSGIYPFSPWERNYLVERDGSVLGHVSGTLVKADGKEVFYVHDLKGAKLTAEDANLVLVAILDHPKMFDAEAVTLLTSGMASSIGWPHALVQQIRGNAVNITYHSLDARLRTTVFHHHVSRRNYDSPESNPTAHWPRPDFARGNVGATRVTIVGGDGKAKPSPKPASEARTAKERLQWLATRLAGTDLGRDVPPTEATLVNGTASIFRNDARQSVAAYVDAVSTALLGLGAAMSNRFFEENRPLFLNGLLNCPDLFAQVDGEFERFAYGALYQLVYADTAQAGRLLVGPAAAWRAHPKVQALFDRLLAQRGPEGARRLGFLSEAGVPVVLELVTRDRAYVRRLLHCGEHRLVVETLRWLETQGQLSLADDDWDAVAALLDNELAADEEWTEYALGLMLRTPNLPTRPAIAKELRRSVRYEENKRFRALAALLFHRVFWNDPEADPEGKYRARVAKRIVEDAGKAPELAAEFQRAAAAIAGAPKCAEEVVAAGSEG